MLNIAKITLILQLVSSLAVWIPHEMNNNR